MNINSISKLIFATGAVIIGAFGISKYKSSHPEKYSLEWIKSLSDKEWETERETIRKLKSNPDLDYESAIIVEKLLYLFDKVKSDRVWKGKTPQSPSYHREHGFNLYKPEK